jgi:hypothetical protein
MYERHYMRWDFQRDQQRSSVVATWVQNQSCTPGLTLGHHLARLSWECLRGRPRHVTPALARPDMHVLAHDHVHMVVMVQQVLQDLEHHVPGDLYRRSQPQR